MIARIISGISATTSAIPAAAGAQD